MMTIPFLIISNKPYRFQRINKNKNEQVLADAESSSRIYDADASDKCEIIRVKRSKCLQWY